MGDKSYFGKIDIVYGNNYHFLENRQLLFKFFSGPNNKLLINNSGVNTLTNKSVRQSKADGV